jgi:membrane-associated PAP2 superfamily phosphatase
MESWTLEAPAVALPLPQRTFSPLFWTTVALLALTLGWEASRLDLPLAQLAGTPQGFPWRDQWLLATVLHEGARRLAWLVTLVILAAIWLPFGPLAHLPRAGRVQLAVTTLVAALAVSLLKSGSATSCPWDLSQFGGTAHYVPHWLPGSDGGPGRCFPAGHASSGFSLLGGFFVFRRTHPRLAYAWLAAAAGAGFVLGLAQQWRGAHFMSHTLWTGLVCWCVAYALDVLWRARKGR